MPQIGKQGFNPYLHKPIPKNKIEQNIQENDSMTKANMLDIIHLKVSNNMIYGNLTQVIESRG